jgi:hypothetical protein
MTVNYARGPVAGRAKLARIAKPCGSDADHGDELYDLFCGGSSVNTHCRPAVRKHGPVCPAYR